MPTPKEEVEQLMNDLLPLAKKMLQEHGEFYPYGGWMDLEGKITHVGAKLDDTDHPPSQQLIDLLQQSFRAKAQKQEIKATATIFDVRVIPPGANAKTDAIRVSLDHCADYSVNVFFPYAIRNGDLAFGAVFASRGDGFVFRCGESA